MSLPDLARVRADFDAIAALEDSSGTDRYDAFLVSLVPADAKTVLDVGCGLGRLCRAVGRPGRRIVGIDLSPGMIARAQTSASSANVSLLCGDFMDARFDEQFDCVISSAAMHHMPIEPSFSRLRALVRLGGRLIVHDLRRDEGVSDQLRAYTALAHKCAGRLLRTGRLRTPPHVLTVWNRHGEGEHYLSWTEARQLAAAFTPPAAIHYHWMWRYTLVWDKPMRSER
jgi:SAM-dependent methyltransferase